MVKVVKAEIITSATCDGVSAGGVAAVCGWKLDSFVRICVPFHSVPASPGTRAD